MSGQRPVARIIPAHRTVEGGGFVVRRPFPTSDFDAFDPFLLLDEMGPVDYQPGEAVGAPDHPHRGFETVTYMLEGEFEHEDSAGHRGRLAAGDVQWMTAGNGVVHSEMPSERIRREGGRVHGFQLWVNLPARDKRVAPRYQDVASALMPRVATPDGRGHVKIIAGEALGAASPIETRTPMLYFDVELDPGGQVELATPATFAVAVYVYEGSLGIGDPAHPVDAGRLALLGDGDRVQLRNSRDDGARALVIGGIPLHEPIARYGPFVMNTRDEILEAIDDYRNGRFATIER